MDSTQFEKLIKEQADQIKHLKKAIAVLERRLHMTDRKASRAVDQARRNSQDVVRIKRRAGMD